jgi:hypothetical protein
MALSRTARILIAILLLAAAAFFWVNFFYQSRLAEVPVQDPVTATPTPGAATAEAEATADDAATADAAADAEGGDDAAAEVPLETEPIDVTDAEAAEGAPAAEADAGGDAFIVADEPPVVAIDAPIAVTREVLIADLPFLVTSPLAQAVIEAAAAEEAVAAGPVTIPGRATINPFSPVVVRTPPAPTREVPPAIVAVGSAPVAGAAPAPAPAVVTRAPAPTPRPLAPASPTAAALTRELPTGSVLSSTPDLLRQPRVGTVAERVDLPSMATIALPAAEPAIVAAPPTPRTPVAPVALTPVRPIGMPVVPEGVFVEIIDTGPTEAELAAQAAAAAAEAEAAAAAAEAEAAAAAAEAAAAEAALADAIAAGVAEALAERAAAEAVEAAERAAIEAAAAAEAAERAAADAAAAAEVEAAAAAEAAELEAAAGTADATEPAAANGGVVNGGVSAAPLPAGTNRLTRYLRDNNFVFTGSVMGPVSVGVFRSHLESTPIVVALGQTLPNTDIVLTDLRGMQAELTLEDSTQILSLDLRR